jgi:hypothetical protein
MADGAMVSFSDGDTGPEEGSTVVEFGKDASGFAPHGVIL